MALRKIVIAVDESDDGERAVSWAQANLFRAGDEVHLVHVVSRVAAVPEHQGAPPVDFLPTAEPLPQDVRVAQAKALLDERFVSRLQDMKLPPVTHIIEADGHADAIGNSICRTAEQLGAAAIVMASRSRTKLQEFFLGSVTNFCTHHSRQPVLVVH